MGASWGCHGPPWGRLGGLLGPSWSRLGRPWGGLGGLLGRPGPSWGRLERSWGRLGSLVGRFGLSKGRLGEFVGLSWGSLGCLLGRLGADLGLGAVLVPSRRSSPRRLTVNNPQPANQPTKQPTQQPTKQLTNQAAKQASKDSNHQNGPAECAKRLNPPALSSLATGAEGVWDFFQSCQIFNPPYTPPPGPAHSAGEGPVGCNNRFFHGRDRVQEGLQI